MRRNERRAVAARVACGLGSTARCAHAPATYHPRLELAEVQKALKHMVKPGADGEQATPVVAFPPDGMGTYLTTDERWVHHASLAMAPECAVAGTMVYATALRILPHSSIRFLSVDAALHIRHASPIYYFFDRHQTNRTPLLIG